ncbi:hypothetical protein EU805_15515 [Salipiger sp. IMCC34102]|uniref:hypothetical protein n=1 Tax=Salipiger sp. IMCC34102 TaxID=2510647 RepID=UPI00101DA065|nr:hypothetical protein [Salipiger sp. IMCC34102]RYH01014.1 hypothetical protein EU805_15515 [Salipiger sp. IMCC34102]
MNDLPNHFVIDGLVHPALPMPLKPSWIEGAADDGFDLLGRARDRYHGVLRCRSCETLSLTRINVFRDHTAPCRACIRDRREADAATLGAELLGPDPRDRHYGHYRLSCGHTVRRQFHRMTTAAAGGHAIDCETCREVRYADEARAFGWTLVGPATSGRSGYRRYRHGCGHGQDISIGNMAWGDCSCGGCGTDWSGQPSFVYLFRIDLAGLPVVKLGYSARPAKRLRHQLGIDRAVRTEVLRVVQMASGNLAVRDESACHRHMREAHPGAIVPKAVFGDAINTQGEIYHATALPVLQALLDRIAARHGGPDSSG